MSSQTDVARIKELEFCIELLEKISRREEKIGMGIGILQGRIMDINNGNN